MDGATTTPTADDARQDLTTETTTSTVVTGSSLVYHIYHVGQEKRPRNYSLHTIKDGNTTILAPPELPKAEKKAAKERKKAEKKAAKALKKSKSEDQTNDVTSATLEISSESQKAPEATSTGIDQTNSSLSTALEPTPSYPLKGLKKAALLDNPNHDPRSSTAPYFLHLPKIGFHEPPYTLRRAGTKRGPVACLLHPSSLWQGWRLEFGDVLSQPGVIDGRGVVNPIYGTKHGKDGYLKSFMVPKKRMWGTSGKKYWEEQKANGFADNARVGELKCKAEEVVWLRWEGLLRGCVREYGFEWRGFRFLWKGTRNVTGVRKAARFFVKWNHLKLVVLLRAKDDEGLENEKLPIREMCLARYSCTLGNRKAGRLELLEDVIDKFLGEHEELELKNGERQLDTKVLVEEEAESVSPTAALGDQVALSSGFKARQRLKDVIVATALGMLMIERDKRRFLLELLQQIGEVAGG